MNTPITIAKFPHDESIVRLITNPDRVSDVEGIMQVSSSVNETLLRTRAYLLSVLNGEEGKPHCPFVKQIENENNYFVATYDQDPREVNIDAALLNILDEFSYFSPTFTHAGQAVDTTSIVAAFGHPDAMTPEFCSRLDTLRNFTRTKVLKRGLMLSQMHPFHPRDLESQSHSGKIVDEEKYKSSIPLLIVRRMHKPDHVFMRTEEEKAIYKSFFR